MNFHYSKNYLNFLGFYDTIAFGVLNKAGLFMKHCVKILTTALGCLVLCVFAYGQESQTTKKADEKTADVAITARVEAKELKFEVVPEPDVKFFGTPERKTEWSSDRKNLPKSVEPGVIYRDIGITLKIVSVFSDIDRIVDEALGKKPLTEIMPPEKSSPIPETKPNQSTQPDNDKKIESPKPPQN